ncbi:taurine ABC transporter substrate-binding protein [Cupriavidus sp. EM10]|uniref:taurine ABC transporter substrate-binding protein n=1 Tax=Cupriavidus sp. EM10 TaxID=2839983 RepID=UPI001CECD8A3|nr:ABC transporter substrate-binding protein [Cupriavidus sp. EM10]
MTDETARETPMQHFLSTQGRGFLAVLLLTIAATICGVGGRASAAAPVEVTIGVQSMFAPWQRAIADGEFEKATGWKIHWRQFDSGGDVMAAMAAGDVQIGVAGSSPVAAAVSRGVKVEVFWILDSIDAAEALVVRNGSGIGKPEDLAGKTLAVPFASTTHYHALFALEQYGVTGKVKIINLQPSEMLAAWSRGDIDAAFVWAPALHKLQASGKVILTSGELARRGRPTFDTLVVAKAFSASHAPALTAFTKVMEQATEDYVKAPQTWTSTSPQVTKVARQSGATPADVLASWRCIAIRSPENRRAGTGSAEARMAPPPVRWHPPHSS